jgi:hypothetical protein
VRSYDNDDQCVVLGMWGDWLWLNPIGYRNAVPFTAHTCDYYIVESAKRPQWPNRWGNLRLAARAEPPVARGWPATDRGDSEGSRRAAEGHRRKAAIGDPSVGGTSLEGRGWRNLDITCTAP